MSDLDRIKQKLNIDTMEDQERKKMFKHFIDHGGKPVESKDEPPAQIKSKPSKGAVMRRSPSLSSGSGNPSSGQQQNAGQKQTVRGPGLTREAILKTHQAGFFARWGTHLFAFMNKTTNWNGSFVHKNFIQLATVDLLDCFLDLQRMAIMVLQSKSFEEFEIKHYFYKKPIITSFYHGFKN